MGYVTIPKPNCSSCEGINSCCRSIHLLLFRSFDSIYRRFCRCSDCRSFDVSLGSTINLPMSSLFRLSDSRKFNTHGTRSTFPSTCQDSRSIRTSVCLRCYRTCYTLGTGSSHPSSPPRHRLQPSIRTDCDSACPHCRRGGYSCPTPTIHPRHSSLLSIHAGGGVDDRR